MKKEKCFLAFLFLLTGCANPALSSSHLSTDISSEIGISESSNNNVTSSWNEETTRNIQSVLGEYSIPYFISPSHSSVVGVENGVNYVSITCNNVNEDSAESSYTVILTNEGFTYSSSYQDPYCFKEVSVTEDLCIQYYVEDASLHIIAYLYEERIAEWPESVVSYYIGDVPPVEAESFTPGTSYTSSGFLLIYLYCNKVASDYDLTYKQLLEANNYTVTGNSSMYYATDTTGYITLRFYMYDYQTMYLDMSSTKVIFPNDIAQEVYGENLPECRFENVIYSTNQVTISDGSVVDVIYCDNASFVNFVDYKELLINAGWSFEESESSTYDYIFYKNKGLENEHLLQVAYSQTQSCIAIVLYY